MRKFLTTLVAVVMALSFALPANAEAGNGVENVNTRDTISVKKAAKKMKCKSTNPESVIGPKNSGVECKVKGQTYYVLKYKSHDKAMGFWVDWIDSGYFVARGNLFIIPQGKNGMDTYSLDWAKKAQKRVGGELVTVVS